MTNNKSGRVLIVEDDEAMGHAAVRALRLQDFEVVLARDGASALTRVKEPFDVVVLDLMLPDMSGLEVLWKCRRVWPETEFVVLTGHPTLESAVEALRAGAFDYLCKPVEIDELAERIAAARAKVRDRVAAALGEVARLILAAPDSETLPWRIATLLKKHLAADDVSLMVPGRDGQLRIKHAQGLPEDVAGRVSVPLGQGVVGRVALERVPVILNGPAERDPRFQNAAPGSSVRASIVFPITSGESLLGILNINRRGVNARPFTETDLAHVEVLAASVRLAMENSELGRHRLRMEKLATMGELLAGVSHELATPVAYMQSNLAYVRDHAELLATKGRRLVEDPAVAARWNELGGPELAETFQDLLSALTDSIDGATHIRELVADLKGLSRTDSARRAIPIEEPIRAALRLAAGALKHCIIEVDIQGEPRVEADAARLGQVFINLLTNSAHALEGVAPERRRIRVVAWVHGSRTLVDVTDQANGIPPEIATGVFDPFFTTKPSGKGTGLGLSISRGIVSQHGGTLLLKQTGPDGTTFRVELPAAPAVRAESTNQVDSARASTGE